MKIYGHRESLQVHRTALSDAIHAAVVEALNFPPTSAFTASSRWSRRISSTRPIARGNTR